MKYLRWMLDELRLKQRWLSHALFENDRKYPKSSTRYHIETLFYISMKAWHTIWAANVTYCTTTKLQSQVYGKIGILQFNFNKCLPHKPGRFKHCFLQYSLNFDLQNAETKTNQMWKVASKPSSWPMEYEPKILSARPRLIFTSWFGAVKSNPADPSSQMTNTFFGIFLSLKTLQPIITTLIFWFKSVEISLDFMNKLMLVHKFH
jgi:hypothetical protein